MTTPDPKSMSKTDPDPVEVMARANCGCTPETCFNCSMKEEMQTGLAALASAGFKVLPREPTPTMLEEPFTFTKPTVHSIWRVMWDAAEPVREKD